MFRRGDGSREGQLCERVVESLAEKRLVVVASVMGEDAVRTVVRRALRRSFVSPVYCVTVALVEKALPFSTGSRKAEYEPPRMATLRDTPTLSVRGCTLTPNSMEIPCAVALVTAPYTPMTKSREEGVSSLQVPS